MPWASDCGPSMARSSAIGRVQEDWKECTRCPLCTNRKQVVVGSGSVPADILLIGEAPGKSEDLVGQPFVGTAGRILRLAVNEAVQLAGGSPRWFITNVAGCHPENNRVPTKSEIEACWPRVRSLYGVLRPKVIVGLGKTAAGILGKFPSRAVYTRETFHPAYCARNGGIESSQFQRLVRDLEAVIELWQRKNQQGTTP